MRSRLRGKRDRNHAAVVERFKQNFVSVADTADLGDGFPDLVVSVPGVNLLVEVKMPGENLTADQVQFRERWRGPFMVVESLEDVDNAAAWMRARAAKLG